MSARQSARLSQSRILLDGRVPTIQEKATLHAATCDMSPGTPSFPPVSSHADSRFSILSCELVPHLAVMATDSGIVFSGEKGPMLEQISAICTKEKLEGALAEARACVARGVPSSSEPSDPGQRETRGGVSAPMETVAGISVSFLSSRRVPRGRPPTRLNPTEHRLEEAIDIVGLQETIRQDFTIHELERLCHHQFAWQWLPAAGHSGGILLGVRDDAFSVEDMDRGVFFVNMSVTDRRVHLSWEVIIVYGPANHGRSAEFLVELKNKVERCTTPVVVAGDFNLIRWASDKISPNVDRARMRLLNDCIADLALREIALVGARFTWSNKQADPIRSVLDRVFVSPQ
ncbi:hypothetical protein D1007_44487 [Hordeum vulgare]|nr:hypothetical protein D1007_44487 [Hordeum vulgare]